MTSSLSVQDHNKSFLALEKNSTGGEKIEVEGRVACGTHEGHTYIELDSHEAPITDRFKAQYEKLKRFSLIYKSPLPSYNSPLVFVEEEKRVVGAQLDLSSMDSHKETKHPSLAIMAPRTSITSHEFVVQNEVIKAVACVRKGFMESRQKEPEKRKSTNVVYSFEQAFFKHGKEGNKLTGQIEKFMWDFARVLDIQDSFAPTAYTSIFLSTGVPTAGCLQPRLSGQLLKERTGPIGKKELIKGTMITLIMGMFDAHHENIMVTSQEKKIMFFDNTRCLPNSNGVILRGSRLDSSFRSDLITLAESQETLLPEERASIRTEAFRCLACMNNLREFMRENKPKDFPPGILEMSALDAMEERLENIIKSIADPKVTNLEELTFAVMPDYKLITALTILHEAKESEQLSCPVFILTSRVRVGFRSVDSLIERAETLHIDLSKIKRLADEGAPLSQLLKVIRADWESTEAYIENDSYKVVKYLFGKAAFDAKDFRDIRTAAMKAAYKRLEKAGVSPYDLEMDEVHYSLKYQTFEMSKEIDFQHPPGSVRIDGVLIQDLTLLRDSERLWAYIITESEQLYAKLVEKLASHIQIVTSIPRSSSLDEGKSFLVCSSGVPKDLFYCYYENEKLIKKTFDWRSDPEKIYLDGKPLSEDKFPLLATPTLVQELHYQQLQKPHYQQFLDSIKVHTRVTGALPHQLAIAKPYLWQNEVKGQPKMVMYSRLKSDDSIESLPINYEEWPTKIKVGEESFSTIESFLTNKKMTLELQLQGLRVQATVVELSVPYTSFILVNPSTTPPSWKFYCCNPEGITMRFEVDYLSSPGNLVLRNLSKPEMQYVFFAKDLLLLSNLKVIVDTECKKYNGFLGPVHAMVST